MRTKRLLVVAMTIASTLGLTACGGGGSGDSSSGGAGGGLQKVTLSLPPASPSGAYQLGKNQGFFKDEGIDLQLVINQGGAAVIPGIVAGNPQFATTNVISLLTAADNGIKIMAIAPGSADKKPPEKGLYGVVSPKGSAIAKTSDLAGKTIAINTLKGLGEFTVRQAITNAGGNPSTVKFVEVPFPDMPAALKNKRVDAVWVPEPFLTKLTTDGSGQLVGYTTQESFPGMAVVIFTRDQTDPVLIKKMQTAISKSAAYAQSHTDETKTAAAEFTKLPLANFQAAGMEDFPPKVDTTAIAKVAEVMQQDGWIKNAQAATKAALQYPGL